MNSVTLETARQILRAALEAQQPAWFWGPPGIGKSDAVRQLADELYGDGGAPFVEERREDGGVSFYAATDGRPYLIDVRAVLLDPTDLRGLPHVTADGLVRWAPPAFLPHDPKSRGILFLDELAQAPPLVLSACLQLVLDRRCGEYRLPDGWTVIAASNRSEDRAAAHRIPTPLLNRFLHLDIEVDPEGWQRWAIAADVDPRIRSFIRYRPNLLHAFDPQRAQADRAFPSPRAWAKLARLMNVPSSIRYPIAAGLVGEGAAAELLGYLEIAEQLPPLDTILSNPAAATVPDAPAVLYALAGALASHCRGKTPTACDAALTYAVRMPAEFAVLTVRDCITAAPGVELRPVAQRWISEHLDIFP